MALALATSAPLAIAADLPGAGERVQIVARDQPIGTFVSDLFGRINRPVVASPNLKGTVNGSFDGSVDKVFSDVSKAFNLIGYYDGAAVYVYAANEMSVKTLPANRAVAARVMRTAADLRLADARNMLRAASDGTIVASGTPRFIERITDLAQTAGSADGGTASPSLGYGDVSRLVGLTAQPLEFRVFYLRYARAEDTTISAGGREVRVPGLATIISNLVVDRRDRFNAQPVSYGSTPIRPTQPSLRGQGLASVGAPEVRNSPVLGMPGAESSFGGNEDGGGVAPPTSDTVRIEANPYLNALIVRDVPERMAAYDSLVRALDVEPQLVELEATIIDINTTKLRELGINWRFSSGGVSGLFGDGTDNDLRLFPTDQSRRGNVDNVTPANRGLALSTILGSGREFISRITALEAKGAAKIVSRPQVMTLSNVEAVFDRTRTFYVRVAGRAEVDLFNVTAGTLLRVNPHVFRDHDQTRIRVMIGIEDGTITRDAVENIPIVERSSVNTQAMVAEGESLLLGGMTVDSDTEALDKIPLLGDIPVLGELFKSRSRQRGRIERLFLITPRIATLTPRLAAAAAPTALLPASPAAVPTEMK